ncbi:exodeoxyribonuclease III [Methanoplanus endosymbiosus]|uniref:Exodeoxyribonuclease III n=1 Tax=Methanoplanus endosymbiosus TaxID=33865 RepID=A0A9E7PL55_9EURY|nr:exodeoxyribonuclease III [Methanoplanus endosymbiosus]UUX92179.1 exodeoxyribonuclease III [Methanoplanus endosymbiosus]
MRKRLVSWNVNGIRAVHKKGFLDFVRGYNPDILCIQETRAHEDQLPSELRHPDGYFSCFSSAEKRGYSGVALYTKDEPESVRFGFGTDKFDTEGRIIIADYPDFSLFDIYFPNGKSSAERLEFKLDFYSECLRQAEKLLADGRNVIICGDVNTAHKEIDLARPKANGKVSGFLPVERAWIDKLLDAGFVDSFRMFTKEGGYYSWYDLKSHARERNVGWRIDYFFVSEELAESVVSAEILAHIYGSDHCPVTLEIEL